MFDRKDYDRKRAQRLYDDFKNRKAKLVKETFNNKCFLCETEAKLGMHLHHVVYLEESNYPRKSKLFGNRLKRVEEAEKFPERFRMLCPGCHGLIEIMKRNRTACFDRLLETLGQ